jgi:hypothetical protein
VAAVSVCRLPATQALYDVGATRQQHGRDKPGLTLARDSAKEALKREQIKLVVTSGRHAKRQVSQLAFRHLFGADRLE